MIYLYSLTIFFSAFLVFLVQPMVGKMILPLAGGSPSVWLACMLFFQSMLLGGYLYAHYSVSLLGVKKQAIIHFLLTAAALLVLPISFTANEAPPSNPALWIYLNLLKSIGLPFLLVSSLSPLIQAWFSKTLHKSSSNPYFLYAASNVGSFSALLAYPFLIEPSFELHKQSGLWATGYIILSILLFLCHLQVTESGSSLSSDENSAEKATNKQISDWLISAFIPSSMLMGVTLYITTDLAPIPLLWVIPLMLYLLTFSLAFSRFNVSEELLEKLALASIFVYPVAYFFSSGSVLWYSLPTHLCIFFIIALYHHSKLARTSPPAGQLTFFYVWLAVGGVIGGLFNSIIAPLIFDSYIEYPLMIVATAFLIYKKNCSSTEAKFTNHNLEIIVSLATGIILAGFFSKIMTISPDILLQRLAISWYLNMEETPLAQILQFVKNFRIQIILLLLFISSLFPIALYKYKVRLNFFLISIATMLTLAMFDIAAKAPAIHTSRNFFGQKIVRLSPNSKYLTHGSTIHGTQFTDPAKHNRPTSYFHNLGPMGDIFSLPIANKNDLRVGIIGLGIGSIAAYSKPGQEFTFIEIDPEIIDIAGKSSMFFNIIPLNASQTKILCGDGRLVMQQFSDSYFDVVIIDAFSSDSIPVHLITIEAVKLYLEKMKPDGLLVFHISNRYLDLHLVLSALARELQIDALRIFDNKFNSKLKENELRQACEYMVLSRNPDIVNSLLHTKNNSWNTTHQHANKVKAWTDSYSSIISILR